ncbi:hypothetical protein P261_02644 [Lachnospiraceae bacterium TWA4]|nr:hypothetical protein P261_02644 [Lachnospiraceae bacterium TWA4]
MKCPICGNEMKKGKVEAGTTGSITNASTSVKWFSEEELKKKFMRKGINLRINGEGYYCEECMKVVAIFDEK